MYYDDLVKLRKEAAVVYYRQNIMPVPGGAVGDQYEHDRQCMYNANLRRVRLCLYLLAYS